MKIKEAMILFVILISILVFVGCFEAQDSASNVQAEATVKLTAEAQRQVGMPGIVNFQQRKMMKLIYELQDREDIICYAYIKSDYQGKLMFIGKCLGYGVPFSAQFTNPMRVVEGDHELGRNLTGLNYVMTLPQADPNGLYMPTSSSATWLMLLDDDNEPRLAYFEPEIVVSPFPLH